MGAIFANYFLISFGFLSANHYDERKINKIKYKLFIYIKLNK